MKEGESGQLHRENFLFEKTSQEVSEKPTTLNATRTPFKCETHFRLLLNIPGSLSMSPGSGRAFPGVRVCSLLLKNHKLAHLQR